MTTDRPPATCTRVTGDHGGRRMPSSGSPAEADDGGGGGLSLGTRAVYLRRVNTTHRVLGVISRDSSTDGPRVLSPPAAHGVKTARPSVFFYCRLLHLERASTFEPPDNSLSVGKISLIGLTRVSTIYTSDSSNLYHLSGLSLSVGPMQQQQQMLLSLLQHCCFSSCKLALFSRSRGADRYEDNITSRLHAMYGTMLRSSAGARDANNNTETCTRCLPGWSPVTLGDRIPSVQLAPRVFDGWRRAGPCDARPMFKNRI